MSMGDSYRAGREQAGFADVEALEERLSRPDADVIADLARLDGDIAVLGATGKMGPTLARMARRAAPDREVFAVARFSDRRLITDFRAQGITPIAADLLDPQGLDKLPDARNVIVMTGYKFGASNEPERSWAVNAMLPAAIAARLPGRRIVVFSTGCVYPFVAASSGGADEDTPLTPLGEYANSCVGRERLVQWETAKSGASALMFRLNYAIDCRYGVLHDIASKVFSGAPLDLTTGFVNVIWQGDATAMALRSLLHCTSPAAALNVTGPETLSVRRLAEWFGRRFGRTPCFMGEEAPTAWLSNAGRAFALMGYPKVSLEQMLEWVADWIERSMPSLHKPTGFEVRTGAY
jgi:nucleoside-diphosphate-sugar epimerase